MAEGGTDYKRGLALIFIQKYERKGSEKDVAALEEVFTLMNIKVVIHDSKTVNEIKAIMQGYQKKPEYFEKFAYVIIVNLSHGENNGNILIPNEKNKYEKIRYHKLLLLPLFKIKQLDGKLKWLIIEACAGDKDLISKAPTDGDKAYYTDYYLISHASSEGAVVYRHEDLGSVYIQELCEQLHELSAQCGVLEILASTAAKVPQRLTELVMIEKKEAQIELPEGVTQRPTFEKNFDDEIYFFN